MRNHRMLFLSPRFGSGSQQEDAGSRWSLGSTYSTGRFAGSDHFADCAAGISDQDASIATIPNGGYRGPMPSVNEGSFDTCGYYGDWRWSTASSSNSLSARLALVARALLFVEVCRRDSIDSGVYRVVLGPR
jgi:hypothetical protein